MKTIIDMVDKELQSEDWNAPNFNRCNDCGCVLYEGEEIEGNDGEPYCLDCTIKYNNENEL